MKPNKAVVSVIAAMLLLAGVALAKTGMKSDDGSTKHAISAKDLKERLDKGEKIVIIDARAGLNGQIIRGALHVPEDKLKEWSNTADKAAVIVTYCTCPHDEASEEEVEMLLKWGFPNAFSLTGGLKAALAAGIEVVVPKQE